MTGPTRPIAPFLNLYPEIDNTAFIAATAASSARSGFCWRLAHWHQVTLRGDNNYITVGSGTNIQDNSCVHINSKDYPAIIGNNVNIGHSALVHACTLHDHAFVGMGAIVLDGAVIESDAMLAAGAMLTPGKRIPTGELWAGRPARKCAA